MKAEVIREKFLHFFEMKSHVVKPSASLVPIDDPTLLWINSGVATLKPYFDGRVRAEHPRIVFSQKCIRTNDIENVGYTARHHTFFEMLGNFSIGDYFKREAILWAWEFLTSSAWLNLDPTRLYVTIHTDDDDAYNIWLNEVGVPSTHIVRLDENFWDLGEGPSGPNTEIFYDRGSEFGDVSDFSVAVKNDDERFLEIWNLVFSEYNHNADHTYTPLPRKNIDTGMGLERIASVLQGVATNYDIDLFKVIMDRIGEEADVKYGTSKEIDTAYKVIADHIRMLTFTIGDGVLPSNEGKGYVSRRLLRRAARYGRKLGITEAFLYKLVGVVVSSMGKSYPEIVKRESIITDVIHKEEERFGHRLDEGIKMLNSLLDSIKQEGNREITGEDAFKMYDTYGFPLDLTEDLAKEHSVEVDRVGFEQAMNRQRERARAARDDTSGMQVQSDLLLDDDIVTLFVGYDQIVIPSTNPVLMFQGSEKKSALSQGEEAVVILSETPFYAESGGQISDTGYLEGNGLVVRVQKVVKGPGDEHLHQIRVESGVLDHNTPELKAVVDLEKRRAIECNHTATHLLQSALRAQLGDHVQQAGSLVTDEILRFDFVHTSALNKDELLQIERVVNQYIRANKPVDVNFMPFEEAKSLGAMTLFSDKYGDIVRVVSIGDYSLELCGGTHVNHTGQLGLFKIISESSIGSGVRRIEAVTGERAYSRTVENELYVKRIAKELKCQESSIIESINSIKLELKSSETEGNYLRQELNRLLLSDLSTEVALINDIPVLIKQFKNTNIDGLKDLVKEIRGQLSEGVIILTSCYDEKAQLVVSVSTGYIEKGINANKIIKPLAALCDGGGGGRADLAQAGGKDCKALARIQESALEILGQSL